MALQIKFGTSGWRAVMAEEFTFANVRLAVSGIARYVASQKPRAARVIVGRDPRFLETAEACADYYITHSNSDGIPPWDFNAPPESRKLLDTSSAAIAASGLLRLCRLLQDPVKGHYYWSTAILILRTLCEKHLAKKDKKWEGILKGGVYHLHKELGVDESVMWGEYFFVEALEQALLQL